ncbi:MAG: hypothetical protein J0H64_08350, partial [Actinobacteria bacterium]|nr:hypothetical protein [Actinomycetota bacterium]
MTAPVEYVLLHGEGFEVPAALAAECGMGVAELAELLELAAAGDDSGESGGGPDGTFAVDAAGSGAVRLPLRGVDGSGSRLIVAVRLAPVFGGPGAPSAQDRCFEAGLRLGAAAAGGRFWLGETGPDADADTDAATVAAADSVADSAERDALWRGAYLGSQRPGVDGEAVAPTFADGGEPAATTVAR